MSENRSRNLPVRKSDYKFKVTIAGDQHVGKTQILKRIVKGTFSSETRATIGIEHSHKQTAVEGKNILIQFRQFWDTPSDQCHRDAAKIYFRKCHALILVYDVSERASFEHLAQWYKEINEVCSIRKIPVAVVGNKIDLEKKVSGKEGKQFADLRLVSFFEVSAKNNIGLNEFFENFTQEIYKSHLDDLSRMGEIINEKNSRIELNQKKKVKKSSQCC